MAPYVLRQVATTSLTALLLLCGSSVEGQPVLCELDVAAAKEMESQIAFQARLAERQLLRIQELESLMSLRDWIPNKPMIEQMTSNEANRHTEVSQAINAGTLVMLIEARRQRDIRVIARLGRLSDQTARYGLEMPPSTASEDAILLGALFAMRELLPLELVRLSEAFESGAGCDLATAFLSASKSALEEFDAIEGADEATSSLENLKVKYGTDLDPNQMSTRDREHFLNSVQPIMRKAMSRVSLAQDMLRLSLLERVSRLVLESWRQDLYGAPGDVESLGTTWSAWVTSGRVTTEQDELVRVLMFVNDKIPSEAARSEPTRQTVPP